jgi:hypothetical protein
MKFKSFATLVQTATPKLRFGTVSRLTGCYTPGSIR